MNRNKILTFCLAVAVAAHIPGATAEVRVKERIPVDKVWSGHPVGFALRIHNGNEYAAYYDQDRNMTIASRPLDSKQWTIQHLPSRVGWDSHNYITMDFDRDGHMHVTGNMHGDPLIYFRTTRPGDITSLERVGRMTGDREFQMTYPSFMHMPDGSLVFSYRDGGSGRGTQIYNRYDEQSRTWSRLLDKPLFDGTRPASIPRPEHDNDDMMNAYLSGPTLGPDGMWHMTWVWRDTGDAGTNHNLSYARSADLINWETVDGKPIELPITLDSPGLILDPVPAFGGIINGSGRIGFDHKGRVVIAYHKFDDKGATQMYLARAENGKWNIRQITDWTHRWDPRGHGTLIFDVSHSALRHDEKLGYFISLSNKVHGSDIWEVNPETLQLTGKKIRADQLPDAIPHTLRQATQPGMVAHISNATGDLPEKQRHLLRWETLPINQDRPREGPLPAPTQLELIIIE